mmetsp:Transcript_120568/g.240056  ORF Transcript_120568/g.240056 Transcript_120568/m.240056 type:complete len:842 (+) Transcript_120568:154-2679(+)
MSTWSPPLSTRIGFRQLRTWSPVLTTTAVGQLPARATPLDGSMTQVPARAVIQRHGGSGPLCPATVQGSMVQGCTHPCAMNPKSPRSGSPMNSARKTQRRTQVGVSRAITQCPTPMRSSLGGGSRSKGNGSGHVKTPVGSAACESARDLASPHPRSPSPTICRNTWQCSKVAQGFTVSVCPPPVGAPATTYMHHNSATPSSNTFIPHTASATPTLCKTNSAVSACGSSLSLTPGCTGTAPAVAVPVTVAPSGSCPSKPTNRAGALSAAHLNTHMATGALAQVLHHSRNSPPAGQISGPPSSPFAGPPPQARGTQQKRLQTKRAGANSLTPPPKGMVLQRNHPPPRLLTARTSTPSGAPPAVQRGPTPYQRGLAAAAAALPPPPPPQSLPETSPQSSPQSSAASVASVGHSSAVHSLLPLSRALSMDPPPRVSSLDVAHQARLVSVDPLADTVPSLDVSVQHFQSPESQDNRQQEQLPDPAWKRMPSPDPPQKRLQSLDALPRLSQVVETLPRLRSMELPLQMSPLVRRCSSPAKHITRSCSPLRPSLSRGCPPQSALLRLHSAPNSPQRQLALATPSPGNGTITSARHQPAVGSTALPRPGGGAVPSPCATCSWGTLPPRQGLGSLVQGLFTASATGGCRSQCGLSPQSADDRVLSTPVASCKHRASPSHLADNVDLVDQAVWQQLMGLDQDSLVHLRVRRFGANRYELDGRNVILRWGPRGDGDSELFVREEGQADWVPLQAYIQQAANVAAALKGRVPGAPAVARIPQEKRLTFGSPGASDDLAGGSINMEECLDFLQRCASMRKACEEAKLRERAAEAYEHGLADFSPGPHQCPGRDC